MEEILASIRRILNEDPVSEAAATVDPDDGVLVLDKSMIRNPADAAEAAHAADIPESEAQMAEPPPAAAQTDMASDVLAEPPAPEAKAAQAPDLVAPEAAAAAAMAMGNLIKQTIEVNGRRHLVELALHADCALVQAFLADYLGNLSYALTARNFNPIVAMAGETVIACAEHIVPAGMIPPDHVITPAPVVDYLIANVRG
jgi:acyl CoA:acetate/3-ketoacid CoA transferase alpha subunit